MEALLDPGRRLIQEGLFGRMGFHQRCGPNSVNQGDVIPETPRVSKLASSSLWEPARPQDNACFLGTY